MINKEFNSVVSGGGGGKGEVDQHRFMITLLVSQNSLSILISASLL